MDADFKEKPRSKTISRKRWSMNSQRLEETVAELMKPISNLRHCFDTDLSALLEEYLTEAGLRALDGDEEGDEGGVVPNFAELALLVQQSACIYGRKVDLLYQQVLEVSDCLHHDIQNLANSSTAAEGEESPAGEGAARGSGAGAAQTPPTPRRRRRASTAALVDFQHIDLESSSQSRREPTSRPPPTLPRAYIELEPAAGDSAPLTDYSGETIGVLADFHVAWRVQNGLLVEELAGYTASVPVRPIPLLELQAAIEANAPPSPPPLPLREDSPPPGITEPDGASTPLPGDDSGVNFSTDESRNDDSGLKNNDSTEMPPPPPPKRERKRKADNVADFVGGKLKFVMSEELRKAMRQVSDFDGASPYVAGVVEARSRGLLLARRSLLSENDHGLRGFDYSTEDTLGFTGWSEEEITAGAAAARATAGRVEGAVGATAGGAAGAAGKEDSDVDDGFFEQSCTSSTDSEHSRTDDSPLHSQIQTEAERARQQEAAEWAAWRARAADRAKGQESKPLDVRALAESVLSHLPSGGEAKPFSTVLSETVQEQTDVSRLFLATLFLANAGNVEVIQGPPLSLDSFSLKLVSSDPRLYCAAAASDPVSMNAAHNDTITSANTSVTVSNTSNTVKASAKRKTR